MTLTFYTHPQSRGRMVRWMLQEVGEPYDTVLLDFDGTMKAPDYLAVNPMGKVPALRHEGRVITEVGAIIGYLAETFPAAGLMPKDRASFYRWMFFGAGPLEAVITNTALGVEVPPHRRRMVGYGSLAQVMDTLDAELQGQPYFCDDRFSAVDLFVGSLIGYGLRLGTITDRPALTDYWTRIAARPASLRAQEIDNALLAKG